MATFNSLRLHLNFDVNATWKVKSHKRIDSLVGRFVDVDQTVVCPKFEVLHGFLVDVRSTNNAEASEVCGKRYWTFDSCASSFGGIYNLFCALID